MAENGTFTFSDPDSYAGAFGGPRINLTVTGAGDFRAKLSRLKLKHLEICRFRESVPRIAYISLPAEWIFVSFSLGKAPPIFNGFNIQEGNIILHGRGARMHQRTNGECQWGLLSLSPEHLEGCNKALTARSIELTSEGRILRPPRAEVSRFRHLFRQACQLAETRKKLIAYPGIARALEQEMLHAIINCLAAGEVDDNPKTRHHHAALMARFEEALEKHSDQKINMPALCAEIGVPERTLRMCCAEFLGVSPMRYLLLQRLNKARSALRRADPSTASVTQIARNHQFVELGRFSVTYRTTFGETPSTTLERGPPSSTQPAEGA
jgi:AraC-like DNA-binding protein